MRDFISISKPARLSNIFSHWQINVLPIQHRNKLNHKKSAKKPIQTQPNYRNKNNHKQKRHGYLAVALNAPLATLLLRKKQPTLLQIPD
tara:strand:+ start:288 stop:554 length:267 start_codon:yes stop_codon:yes gene_type:complete